MDEASRGLTMAQITGAQGARQREENRARAKAMLPTDPYVARQLLRVRKQIDLLNDAIEAELAVDIPAVPPSEKDPNGTPAIGPNTLKVDRYAKSLKNLSEREERLAGRPGPGNYRPVERKTTKPSVEPIDG